MRKRWLRRFFLVVLGLGMLVLLLRLGFWQLDRAEIKEDLLKRFSELETASTQDLSGLMQDAEASRWHFRRAHTTGSFMSSRQYLLDNRTHEGKAGYHVLTPLAVPGGTIMVNRGWVPVGNDRRVLPTLKIDELPSSVTGRLVPPPRPGLLLGSDGYEQGGWPRVVQAVNLERMSEQLGERLMPALLQLDPAHEACQACIWRPVGGIGPQRHRGYALQWFSLAAALVVLMGMVTWLEFRREQV